MATKVRRIAGTRPHECGLPMGRAAREFDVARLANSQPLSLLEEAWRPRRQPLMSRNGMTAAGNATPARLNIPRIREWREAQDETAGALWVKVAAVPCPVGDSGDRLTPTQRRNRSLQVAQCNLPRSSMMRLPRSVNQVRSGAAGRPVTSAL